MAKKTKKAVEVEFRGCGHCAADMSIDIDGKEHGEKDHQTAMCGEEVHDRCLDAHVYSCPDCAGDDDE